MKFELMNMAYLAQMVQPEQDGAKGAAIWFVPACLLAILIFGFGVSKEREGGKKLVKYFGIPLLAGAAWITYPYFKFATDGFNKNIGAVGGSAEWAYKISFLAPLILAIVLVGVGIGISKFVDNETRF